MRQVSRSALVTHSCAQMFALVEDFERYPEFLPWVTAAKCLSHEGNELIGRLDMERVGVREHFITRNVLDAPHRMDMHLVEGPFKTLEGHWQFTPIVDAQGLAQGTRVQLDIRFEFKNALLEMLLGKVFEASCGSLVEAFTRRAKAVYGPARSV